MAGETRRRTGLQSHEQRTHGYVGTRARAHTHTKPIVIPDLISVCKLLADGRLQSVDGGAYQCFPTAREAAVHIFPSRR